MGGGPISRKIALRNTCMAPIRRKVLKGKCKLLLKLIRVHFPIHSVDRLHMSFTYNINKAGPRIEPCGTPHDKDILRSIVQS